MAKYIYFTSDLLSLVNQERFPSVAFQPSILFLWLLLLHNQFRGQPEKKEKQMFDYDFVEITSPLKKTFKEGQPLKKTVFSLYHKWTKT